MTIGEVIGRYPEVRRWVVCGFVFSVPFLTATASLVFVDPAISGDNLITPDGRTNTTLTTNGNVTDISTGTISGANAFNSFNQFQVGDGNTVNLRVPDAAENLLNVVRGGPVSVEGTLNAYKNGEIGGNVYFADPYGFVVGPNGAVNVGTLTVTTPKKDVLDRLIDGGGKINDAAAAEAMSGATAVSPDGTILVKGRINARNGVKLSGQSVTISGPGSVDAFQSSVNTNGLAEGGAVRITNGQIEITAASDVVIGGTLGADGATSQAGGKILLQSGNDIQLDSSARISAAGRGANSNGGQIDILAGRNLNVGPGVIVDASGGSSGNGGRIELSAKDAVNLSRATLNAGAPNGTAGLVLIDPTNVTISGASGSIDSNGADVAIVADHSITIDADGYINTRQTGMAIVNDVTSPSIGNSGDVSLNAPQITVNGSINAFAINDGGTTFEGGDITLTASASDSVLQGIADSTSRIDIAGTLKGRNITAVASAESISSYDDLGVIFDGISSLFGANVGVVDARADARINVNSGANIVGSGDVTLNAWTSTIADDRAYELPILTLLNAFGSGRPFPSVIVGNVKNRADSRIASGASVSAGGALTVRAHNDANLAVATTTITFNTPIDVSVTYTTADALSNALIDPGATVGAGSARITARNDNAFSNTISILNLGQGDTGLAVAIADGYSSIANANLGSSLSLNGPAPSGDAQLVVAADTVTSKDVLKASTQVGQGFLENLLFKGSLATVNYVGSKLSSKFQSFMNAAMTGEAKPKIGSAMALNLDEYLAANARIAGDPAAPPVINATGAVAVIANVDNGGVSNVATSTVNSPNVKDAVGMNPGSSLSLSAGITISKRELDANAEIGTATEITAPQIGVHANAVLPFTPLFDWSDLLSAHVITAVLEGLFSPVVTTYSASNATTTDGGFAGAVNYFDVEANSTAFVGKGAKLTSTGANAQDWWAKDDSGVDSTAGRNGSASIDFSSQVSVVAERTLQTIHLTNLGTWGAKSAEDTSEAAVFGGALQGAFYSGKANAGIAEQAVVVTGGDLDVSAISTDRVYLLAPAAGMGAGLGVTGMFSLFGDDGATRASISSDAAINARSVTVDAEQHFNVATLAGGVQQADDFAVGAIFTSNSINTETSAFVGDNSDDDPSAALPDGFAALGNPSTTVTGDYNVKASDSGRLQSLAVSFQAATGADTTVVGISTAASSVHVAPTAVISGATISANDLVVDAHARSVIETVSLGVAASTGEAGIDVAGSSAVGVIGNSPQASIEGGAVIDAANNVGVFADDKDVIETLAGAGAIGNGGFAIGLSVVVNQISGTTEASITGADTVVNARGLDADDTLTVNTGMLASPIDTGSINLPTAIAPDLDEDQEQVSGLVVSATSTQSVVTNAVTAGISGGSAGSINTASNILGGSTLARIEDAHINTDLNAPVYDEDTGDAITPVVFPDTVVRASSHTYAQNFVAAIALSDNLSGAGASGVNDFNRKTDARVRNALLGTLDADAVPLNGALIIGAFSTQDAPQIVIGGALGMGGGAASLAVTLFNAETDASAVGGTLRAGTLNIAARSDNGVNHLVGAGAIGESGGISGSVSVVSINNKTLAFAGDEDGDVNTQMDIAGAVAIAADTKTSLHTLTISGAGGYDFGIAAMTDVALATSKTIAGVYNTSLDANIGDGGDVSVTASEYDRFESNAGSLAIGSVAIGASANYISLHSEVAADVINSDIETPGLFEVAADSERNIDMVTVTGAIGYYAGISAAVGIIEAGNQPSIPYQDQLNAGGSGTLSNAQSLQQGACPDGDTSCTSLDMLSLFANDDPVRARVSGGSVSADAIEIAATGTVSTSNLAVAAGVGAAGVGGSVAVTAVGGEIDAALVGASVTATDISISAEAKNGSTKAADNMAIAGGGGVVGAGAGVAQATIDNAVDAIFSGTAVGDGSGTLAISAKDSTSISAEADGGAVGGVAIGIMVADASKSSVISAWTGAAAAITDFQNVSLNAADSGDVSAASTGVAGGLAIGGTAVSSTASDSVFVFAGLGAGTQISGVDEQITIAAADTLDVSADAYGVAVGGSFALGVSVALADVKSTVYARTGDDVILSGGGALNLNASGNSSADSSAFAGSGGQVIAANGAIAISKNRSKVEATTGDDNELPAGDIAVLALNLSNQTAYASGISVGGGVGGASYAEANSSGVVTAALGARTTDAPTRSLTVQATGTDYNDASALAGVYGVVAGNAAVARTFNTSHISTIVGDGTALMAGNIHIGAVHADHYVNYVDSTNVSALGASGAYSSHDADVDVTTTIGNDVELLAGGTLEIAAQSNFYRTGNGNSAEAAGGGVINGAAAVSSTSIESDARVITGDNVTLTSGFDAITNPGGIVIVAGSEVIGEDVVTLSTGGALQGSGTKASFKASLNNSVDIGEDNFLLSFGNINVGTYTFGSVVVKSLGSTWGIIGAISDAESTLDFTSNQDVVFGLGSQALAYGNINFNAGRDPANANTTIISASTIAESYARGFIGIPGARAVTNVDSNNSVVINGRISGGENVSIGSYKGTVTSKAKAKGHGYELWGIPVTNGVDHANQSVTADVAINADVTAGAYNNVAVEIPDCANDGAFCSSFTVTGGFDEALAFAPATYLSNFDPVAYINAHTSPTEAAFLATGVSGSPVGAIELPALVASGGNLSINGQSLSGSGSLTANGGASITIANASPDYLILNGFKIPDAPGGHVYFAGGIAGPAAGLSVTENNPDGAKSIEVTDSFADPVPGSVFGPAIFLAGEIENLGGSVHVVDPLGSLGQFAPIIAQDVVIDVPQGVVLVSLSPQELYSGGASVYAEYSSAMLWPGGNPKNGLPDPLMGVAYAANSALGDPKLNKNELDSAVPDGSPNSNKASYVVFGNCAPFSQLHCHNSKSKVSSPIGTATKYITASDPVALGSEYAYVATVPSLALSKVVDAPIAQATSDKPALTANRVLITASYIDINSDVIVGPANDWTVILPTALNAETATLQANTAAGTKTELNGATVLVGGRVVTSDDANALKVYYQTGVTADSGQIIVDKILASAQSSASIKLDGQIIGTSPYGHIHVNAGLGNVTVDNQTASQLVVNNIAAGNADASTLVGTVEIIDRLPATPIHEKWVYRPGQGTDYYYSNDPLSLPDAPTQQFDLASSSSFDYEPVDGARWEWTQEAFLSRTLVDGNRLSHPPPLETVPWHWTDPSGNALSVGATNPWYYLDPATNTLTTNPAAVGRIVVDPGNTHVMTQDISGTVGIGYTIAIRNDVHSGHPNCSYRGLGCSQVAAGTFESVSASEPADSWNWDYVGNATLKMVTSVKADYGFGISFSGGLQGKVAITSDKSVTVAGQINNPGGTTSITSNSGDVFTAADGSVKSRDLSVVAGGAVGSAANPFVVTMTGGALDASGDAGVFISGNSDLILGNVASLNGDVSLTANGDIKGLGSASAFVSGANVTLTAVNDGSIGSASTPIMLNAGGVLNASASGDIAITQMTGDLRVGEVISTGFGGVAGNVNLKAPNGAIYNAAGTTSAQVLSEDEVQDIWSRLKLTVAYGAGVNGTSGSATVTGISSTLSNDYRQYWGLIANGSVSNGGFTLNAGPSPYDDIAAALGMTSQDYAAQLYRRVAGDFARYMGENWQSGADFQSFNSGFTFVPDSSLLAKLTNNSSWTEGELLSALSLTAIQPSSDTTVGTATPNVAGSDLSFSAATGIGQLANPVEISITDLIAGNLTTEQKAAIALARNPGDLTFFNDANEAVSAAELETSNGTGISHVSIKQTSPLFVKALGELDAVTVAGGIYLQQTEGDLNIHRAQTGSGEVNLIAPGSILVAEPGPTAIVVGDSVTLLAGSGDIGSSAAPLTLATDLVGSASAKKNIYLSLPQGDLNLGRIFGGATVSLSAAAGAITPTLSGVAIEAQDLRLHAGDDIGSNTRSLQFTLGTNGTLSGDGGTAYLVTSAGQLHVTNFVTQGDLQIVAAGDLAGDALRSIAGSIVTSAGLNGNFGSLQAQGDIKVTSAGTLALGGIDAGGQVIINAGGSATVAANRTVSGEGLVTLHALSLMMEAGSALQAKGDIKVTSAGALALAGIDAGGQVTINSGGATTVAANRTVSGTGAVALHALSLTMESGSAMVSQAALSVIADGNAIIGRLASGLNADKAIELIARLVSGNGDGQTNLTATGANARSSITAQTGIGADDRYITVNTPNLAATTGTGGIYIRSLSNLTMPALSASGDIKIDSAGNLILSGLTTSGSANLSAASTISANQISANIVSVRTPNSLTLNNVVARSGVFVQAPRVALNVKQQSTASNPLTMSIGGFATNSTAASASLSVDAPNGLRFDRFAVTTANIVTTAHLVDMPNGYVEQDLALLTPDIVLYLNNVSPRPIGNVGVQLYAPSLSFFLRQDHTSTLTNAFLINFGADYSVSILNADGSTTNGLSLLNDPSVAMSANTWQQLIEKNGFGETERLFLSSLLAGGTAYPNGINQDMDNFGEWVRSVSADGAVNTNTQ